MAQLANPAAEAHRAKKRVFDDTEGLVRFSVFFSNQNLVSYLVFVVFIVCHIVCVYTVDKRPYLVTLDFLRDLDSFRFQHYRHAVVGADGHVTQGVIDSLFALSRFGGRHK